jgi:hypothetical protein
MSNPYSVSKRQHRVRIRTAAAASPEGVIVFLGERAAAHTGPEQLRDLLNEDHDFLLVKGEQGAVQFIHRDSLWFAAIETDEHDPDPDGFAELAELATRVAVRVTLRDGHEIEGTVEYLLPRESCRLQDHLNQVERFLCVRTKDRELFVNKSAIARVEPS